MARLDHYLDCEAYQNQAASNYEGFSAFSIENDDHPHYFAMTDPDGRVLLVSEGYLNEAGRNNGIESVMRNRDIEERYVVRQDGDDGAWNVCLLAGNKQEIARSCDFATEGEASEHFADCLDYKTARKMAADVGESNRNEDEYLACESYANRGGTDQTEGFSLFQQEESGQFYFSMLDRAGRVMLISEGYPTVGARDNGVQSVIKNRDIPERYSVKTDDAGLEYVSLKAGNHQEIARSCAMAAGSGAGWITQTMAYNMVEEVAEKAVAAPRTSNAVIEDYLPCEAYDGHARSVKYPGFTTFFREDLGQHYFAWVSDSGKVILKSEGYPTTSPRDNGIESVIKNRDIEARWSEKEDEHGHYLSLKAGNHQEIGRSCHYREKGAGWAWLPFAAVPALESAPAPVVVVVPPPVIIETKKVEPAVVVVPPVVIAAAAAAVVAPVVIETKKTVILEKKKAPPVVVAAQPTYVAPVVAPDVIPPVAATSDGCMRYWWLLPLLLLLGLLWWLTKDGCSKKAALPVVPPVVSEQPKQAPAPAPPPVPVCNCNASQDPLFNLSTCTNPTSLTRLGTNPEFGNSHGLTPTQFYEKLAKAYSANNVDKVFLDRVFTGMGYANGWAAARAEMFSEAEVAPGTVGNMGYSKLHKTACDRLDAKGKDLLAFRIKSMNGCDMHFMKTCGNHFFFCTAK